MLRGVFDFFRRRRRTLAVTAGVVGAIYLGIQYGRRKLNELQEKLQSDRLAKENLRRRFEQNQQDCTFTVVALLGSLGDQILESINVEKITQTLQNARAVTPVISPMNSTIIDSTTGESGSTVLVEQDPEGTAALKSSNMDHSQIVSDHENETSQSLLDSQISNSTVNKKLKVELWNELKLKTFIRTFTLLYSLTLLTLLTHVQLNLLGRYNYISSVVSLFGKNQTKEDAIKLETSHRQTILKVETEKKYLTFSWWLLHRGWKSVCERVTTAVESVLSTVSLKKQITPFEYTSLISEIRQKVETSRGKYRHSFMEDLMPLDLEAEREVLTHGGLSELEREIDDELRRLLEETLVILDSEDFVIVLQKSLDKIFEVLEEAVFACFGVMDGGSDSATSGMTGSLHPRFQEILAVESDASGNGITTSNTIHVNQKTVKFASLLPIITRQAHLTFHGFPNEYVDGLIDIKELQSLSAIVYSSFDMDLIQ